MKIRFYKKEDRWYADVPDYIAMGGSEADCEMVAGANVWLEFMNKAGEAEVNLEIGKSSNNFKNAIHKICEDDSGAVYFLAENPDFLMWLCNVSKFVFMGEHPNTIYYNILEEEI